MNMAKILVIDDDQQILKMASVMLNREGHHVLTAESGVKVMQLIESTQPDAIVTDILMPDFDGIEVLTACRDKGTNIPIIAMSGGRRNLTAELNLSTASLLGATEVLAKPFSKEQLIACVSKVLRS
jgi:CheY-like chemotaxis protein